MVNIRQRTPRALPVECCRIFTHDYSPDNEFAYFITNLCGISKIVRKCLLEVGSFKAINLIFWFEQFFAECNLPHFSDIRWSDISAFVIRDRFDEGVFLTL